MTVNRMFGNDKNELTSLKFVDLSYTHLARMELCHLLDLTRQLDHLVIKNCEIDRGILTFSVPITNPLGGSVFGIAVSTLV